MNPLKLIFLTSLIFLPLCLKAQFPLDSNDAQQSSTFGQIYRIAPEKALVLIGCKKEQVTLRPCPFWATMADELLAQQPIDTFHGIKPTRNLPYGSYIALRAIGDHLEMELLQIHSFSVYVRPNAQALEISVYDSVAQVVKDAKLIFEGNTLVFNKKTNSYWLKKCRKSGMLQVHVGNELLFQPITNELDNWSSFRRRRMYYRLNHGIGRVFAYPYRLGYLAKQIILHPFSGNLRYSFRNNHDRHQKKRLIKKGIYGYVVFSQPRYLPGDTLKVKAYIANKKGKPGKRPIIFTVNDGRKDCIKKMLSPTSPGNYEFQCVLNDSFTLDRDYQVIFLKKELPWRIEGQYNLENINWQLEGSFRYEDYQLNTVTYELKTSTFNYQPNDSIQLIVSALDANKQPVPAIDVHVVVTATNVYKTYKNQVYLADTIWQKKQALSGEKTTTIVMPPSILPAVDLHMQATAYFVNSAGEIQMRSCSWNVAKPSVAPALQVLTPNNKRVKIFWKNANKTTIDTAALTVNFANGTHKVSSIKLPFETELPRSVVSILVRSSGVERNEILLGSSVYVDMHRNGDTLFCKIDNPERLELHYVLKGDHKIIEEGILKDTIWNWQALGHNDRQYDLTAHLMVSGKEISLEETSLVYTNQLAVNITAPETVTPGSTAEIQVKVVDINQNPVKNVQLSAMGINAQFGDSKPFEDPQIMYLPPQQPFEYGRFKLNNQPGNRWKGSAPLYRDQAPLGWYERFGLDRFLYYRLLFAPNDNTCYVLRRTYPASDSSDWRKPQFSPFIVKNGIFEPIYSIHCNKKLVYSALATTPQPYSFYGEKGLNEILVRTQHKNYWISGLVLDYGEKVELAVAENVYKRQWYVTSTEKKDTLYVNDSWMPDTLTDAEQAILRKSMLIWRSKVEELSDYYFWQGRHNIRLLSSKMPKTQVLGPFVEGGEEISMLKRFGYYTKFKFESGFVYDIDPNRERLYSTSWPRGLGKLNKAYQDQWPGMLALAPKQIDHGKPDPTVDLKLQSFITLTKDYPGAAALNWVIQLPKDTQLWAIGLRSSNSLIGPISSKTQLLTGLPPGKYEFLAYTTGQQLLRMPIQLRKDSTLYFLIDTALFLPPPKGYLLGDLFHIDSVKTIQKTSLSSTFSQLPGQQMIGRVLYGTVKSGDDYLIGASVSAAQSGIVVKGATTDFDGRFSLSLPPGVYDLTFSYTGYNTQRMTGVQVWNGFIEDLVVEMSESSSHLSEVVVIGYTTSLVSKLSGRAVGVARVDMSGVSPAVKKKVGFLYDKYTETDSSKLQITNNWMAENEPVLSAPLPNIRNQFRDNAYWQPNLSTDKNGVARFQVTFPDNITSWNSYTVAMDRKRRAGVGYANTLSYLPVTAQLMLPRFAVAGDRFNAAGMVSNTTADSVAIETAFYQENQLLSQKNNKIGAGLAEYTWINTPSTGDSLHIRYEMRSQQCSDAEERSIAVLPVGVEEVNGAYWLLEQDTNIVFKPNPDKGELTLYIADSALDLLFEDITYLANYPFGCNEQTSSRLIALLLAREIATYRPEMVVENCNKEIQKCIAQLRKTQQSNGGWGWWAGNEASPWMTIYVLRALNKAKKAGFPTSALDQGLIWLRANLEDLAPANLSDALILLRECGVNIDCTPYLAQLEKQKNKTLNERLIRLRLLQFCGKTVPLDSLTAVLQMTNLGGLYCGEENYHWYNRRAINTLLAYDIADAAQWTDITAGIRRYWLQNRQERPRNTIETAQILLRLLPYYYGAKNNSAQKSTLRVNGALITKFPVNLVLPKDQNLQLSTTGGWPLFATAYQRWFNPQPEPLDSHYRLSSSLYQRGKKVNNGILLRGEEAQLTLDMAVNADAEYVMLEVPIPAGCSYGTKVQPYYDTKEVHREYFRDRTVIFFQNLPKGNYTVNIALQPRFSGTYTLNPAKIEQMYFPVFNGHNVVKRVQVE